ncbi:MAG: ribosomal-processing cysteine protease Prp, partial [Acholeplasmataceae bacterium]|nr:ribosomal-processing cysteine protease Prp [Acholeplasmataceae bacterium]
PKGEDIVCAAVSTAILVTANAIEHLGLTQHTETTIKEGYFNLQVKTDNAIVDGLLKNLEYTFDELKKQYPKYMKNQKEG